jgi:lactoylglutathione lyase
MKIHHVAIWTKDIEKMKNYYVKYFGCKSNEKYINANNSFESYFLEFKNGSKLELMQRSTIPENKNNIDDQNIGLIHIAISVGSKVNVDTITDKLRQEGYRIISEPRITGDGYYESCVLDPEANRIEITV